MLIVGIGFPWDALPDDSIVVDVGGGVSALTMSLHSRFPKLVYIVQDLPGVCVQAREVAFRSG